MVENPIGYAAGRQAATGLAAFVEERDGEAGVGKDARGREAGHAGADDSDGFYGIHRGGIGGNCAKPQGGGG
jgi:hypothetical protein